MTLGEYEKQITGYTINMLNYEKEDTQDNINFFKKDLEEEDIKILKDKIIKNISFSKIKLQLINNEIENR